jgi:hypothetical protein
MAASVTHAKVPSIPDEGGTKVGTDEWIAAHTLTDVGEVLYRNAAVVNATTNVEATLISTTIPANKLGTARGIRFTCFGLFENSTGANQQITMRTKFGSTTSVIADASGNIATATGKRSLIYSGVIHNCNSASLQRGYATLILGANTSASTTVGAGALSGNLLRYSEASTVAAGIAFDTTADQSFTITLQLSTTVAGLNYINYYSVVELL